MEQVYEEDLIDSSTGTVYISKLKVASSAGGAIPENTLQLASVGIRKRWMVSVYSFGMYFDAKTAKPEIERWNTYDIDELSTNLSFYNALIGSKFDKAVKLVLARTIKGSDLQEAFEESLKPRIVHYVKEYSHGHNQESKRRMQSETTDALGLFRDQFDVGSLVKGTEITIRTTGHVLTTYINGEPLRSVESRCLCAAFLDIYLGVNPISTSAKEMFAMKVSLLIIKLNL
eukprot:CAMPEP_0184344650 /NCGR_PEP_ID=MMETSP1089-20130417/13134_1 /TAXON_ID=38269 ORGANISM="Gloeochaete wittrockiana, Strain SAG46.84" /NCGR_SAMPLE_ID=MMETSP1089 /ASSEMBLY_ACC=CAM_ASM_000445 /LENGTH=229 /DNA_ID=CAMNT_0026674583 /DNA_START=51 /DNA_END=736 /DNA_ORIENTATION=-